MNVKYQVNLNNIPNSSLNYANIKPKYISSLYSSPKKSLDNNNYPFNYGMRNYYSAEIKPNTKPNHYYQKPIYILNPYFVANQLSPRKIYNSNSLYILSSPRHNNNNKTIFNYNNNNNINLNNGFEIKSQKTIINNINNINNINPQIHVTQRVIPNRNDLERNTINYYPYNSQTAKTNPIPKQINQRVTYSKYTNPIPDKFNVEVNINNNININNTNNDFNIIQNDVKNKNDDYIFEDKNFNNTMPNLKNIGLSLNVNNEENIYQQRETFPQTQSFNLYENVYKTEDNIVKNNIQSEYTFQNQEIIHNPIINTNNNINIINNINNLNNINLNIIQNNINDSNLNNYENNFEVNEQVYYMDNKSNDINYQKSNSEPLPQINVYNNLYVNENNTNNIIYEKTEEEVIIDNLEKPKEKEIKIENKYEQNNDLAKEVINNLVNQKNEEKIKNQIENIKIEKENPINNVKLNENKPKEEINFSKKDEITNNEQPLNIQINIIESKIEDSEKNNTSLIKQEKLETNPDIDKNNNNICKANDLNNNVNISQSKENISNEQNKKNNKNEEKKQNKNNNKTKKKKRSRPVYKIPPSKKRSISQGKSLAFIHKYYDENFILEEDSEDSADNSSEMEIKKLNKEIITTNVPKKVFKEVNVRKIQKINDIQINKNEINTNINKDFGINQFNFSLGKNE